MPKTKWNAPGCYYMLKYREENLRGVWRTEKIGDPSVHVFSVSNPGYYQPWEFKICAGNHQGLGPESPISRSFSGQDAPDVKPDGAETQGVNATSVALAWQPVTLNKGSVDGYKVHMLSVKSGLRLNPFSAWVKLVIPILRRLNKDST